MRVFFFFVYIDVVCSLIFYSATAGGILDRAIEAEDRKHGDFLRLVCFSSLPFRCAYSYLHFHWYVVSDRTMLKGI